MESFVWAKRGRIFDPTTVGSWMHSHAQNPVPLLLDDRIRVYFNTRLPPDEHGNYVARVTFIELDRRDFSIRYIHDRPVLPLGGRGEFDEFGTMASSVVYRPELGEHWMYYVGWTRMVSVPFNWAVGVARSVDGGRTFERIGCGPVLGPALHEPYLQACPVVSETPHGLLAWYCSGITWLAHENEPIYRIFRAESDDGLSWRRDGRPIIPPVVTDECQTSPTVLDLDGRKYMFFSYRHGTDFRRAERGYRIGCAVSDDGGMSWRRIDAIAGLVPSRDGWDSEMICYPYIFRLDGRVVMFYCGNYFGREGFGWAVMES